MDGHPEVGGVHLATEECEEAVLFLAFVDLRSLRVDCPICPRSLLCFVFLLKEDVSLAEEVSKYNKRIAAEEEEDTLE